jgi:hypothetical protein
MNQRNPWNLERLRDLIGQEESLIMEFKSTKGIEEGPKSVHARKFLDGLSADVSAMLNSEGGRIVIGLEEDKGGSASLGRAAEMSHGVPRSQWSKDQLSSAICDRIHPSVASFVNVYPIALDAEGEARLAFVVEIDRGITAYQAADKRYHGRNSQGTYPMEDKDVRLRMLGDQRPRAKVTTSPEILVDGMTIDRYIEYREERRREFEALSPPKENPQAWKTENIQRILDHVNPHPPLVVSGKVLVDNIGNLTISSAAYLAKLKVLASDEREEISQSSRLTYWHADPETGGDPIFPGMEGCLIGEYSFQIPSYRYLGDLSLILIRLNLYLDNGMVVTNDLDLLEHYAELRRMLGADSQ